MTDAQPFKPTFVPSHLQGKVSDFRRLGDGSVSFAHPSAASGTFGEEASRRTIDPDTYAKTFDPRTRSRSLEATVNGQYTGPSSDSVSDMVRKWVGNKAGAGWQWGTSNQARSVGTAGLLAALAGGGYGAYSALGDEEGSPVGRGLLYSLLAGGAAAGATALGQHYHNKRENALTKVASVESEIAAALTQDASITYTQRQAAIQGLAQLGENELAELKKLIRVGVGASVGALNMRFLKGKGLLPTIAGGIIGAVMGRATVPGQTFNAMGQPSTNNLR